MGRANAAEPGHFAVKLAAGVVASLTTRFGSVARALGQEVLAPVKLLRLPAIGGSTLGEFEASGDLVLGVEGAVRVGVQIHVPDHRLGGHAPFVALGAGERRSAALHGGVRLSAWDYDLVYSWMLGAEINDPFYARFPGAYAAWDYAHSVVLRPSVFDARFGPANWKHFVAYARGAAGLDLDSE